MSCWFCLKNREIVFIKFYLGLIFYMWSPNRINNNNALGLPLPLWTFFHIDFSEYHIRFSLGSWLQGFGQVTGNASRLWVSFLSHGVLTFVFPLGYKSVSKTHRQESTIFVATVELVKQLETLQNKHRGSHGGLWTSQNKTTPECCCLLSVAH